MFSASTLRIGPAEGPAPLPRGQTVAMRMRGRAGTLGRSAVLLAVALIAGSAVGGGVEPPTAGAAAAPASGASLK